MIPVETKKNSGSQDFIERLIKSSYESSSWLSRVNLYRLPKDLRQKVKPVFIPECDAFAKD